MNSSTNTSSGIVLSNSAYDKVRSAAQNWLPAAGTLYFALAAIWGLPYGEQVVGTITALVLFLGVVMGFSKKAYDNQETQYDGALVVDTMDEGKDVYRFEVETPLDDLREKDTLTIKVLKTD